MAPSLFLVQKPCRVWNNKHPVQLNRGCSTNAYLREAERGALHLPCVPSSYSHIVMRFQLWNVWLWRTTIWSYTTRWERLYIMSACKQPRSRKERTHTLTTPNQNRIKERKVWREQGWKRNQTATKVHCTRKSTEKSLSGINLWCSLSIPGFKSIICTSPLVLPVSLITDHSHSGEVYSTQPGLAYIPVILFSIYGAKISCLLQSLPSPWLTATNTGERIKWFSISQK